MLRIYNTMSGRKELFEPLVPGTVRMYVCGVTVYDYSHLGHARSALIFDIIRNYLQFAGYVVRYVRNFTDVDDKIILKALQEDVSWTEIVERYLQAYRDDMARLGVQSPDVEPRATQHILDIIDLIKTLVAKGHAYNLNGDVYYEVKSYQQYGRLSKRKTDELLAGARVEVDERKRSPLDFALWKSSKPGEPAWDSPWGPGRPGWHIECSAMSMKHLGETFDIHGGGMDLIFPHHENEIAQSCSATGKEFAHYWLHNGFVQINQQKMSKSLGNFFTIREIFEQSHYNEYVTAESLRYLLLSTHYRSPLDFSDRSLYEAKRSLNSFYGLFQRLDEPGVGYASGDVKLLDSVEQFEKAFRQAMDDDFNTPAAIAEFQKLRGELNQLLELGLSGHVRMKARRIFRNFGKLFGLFQLQDWQFKELFDDLSVGIKHDLPKVVPVITDTDVESKIAERNEARRQKDFIKADEIRKYLAAQGITIEDRSDGTSRWKR
jgi:cysteinyl-tRNA synthetase